MHNLGVSERFCASLPFSLFLTADGNVTDCFLCSNPCNFWLSQSFPIPFMQFLICMHVYLSFLYVIFVFRNWQGSLINFMQQTLYILFRSCSTFLIPSPYMLLCSFCYNCTGGTVQFICSTFPALTQHVSRFGSDFCPLRFPCFLFPSANEYL
jgi:hypothetical protein